MLAQMLMRKAQARVSSLSYVGNAVADYSTTITIPASAQAGDIAVLKDLSKADYTNEMPGSVVPSGWTVIDNLIYDANYVKVRQIFSYKVLASNDPGSSITGMAEGTKNKLMFVFRPNVPISNLSVEQFYSQVTDGTPTTMTITPCALPYVVIGSCASYTQYPYFQTNWFTSSIVSQFYQKLAYKIFNSNAANVSINMTDQGNFNTIQCCALVVS